ncbi:prepilin peptidase [Haloparvum sp. PAK95]|uniref:A24 family peptidase n=1 Tax=Haloparvum sp. PAK95 TaxID=3418962 RepID=UPI003D2EBDA8
MLASVPDLLRLLLVPLFGWAAYRDVRTRRLPNRLWPPLYAFGLLLLGWETLTHWPLAGIEDRLFLLRVGLSLLFVAPLGYVFWRIGGFGGADAKALIAVALVYPTFPTYILPVAGIPALPAVETYLGVFSLTILTNTVLVGALYPLGLAVYNAAGGRVSPAMFLARPVPVERLPHLHGRLFETREGFTRRGLDVDALRMYLRWRGLTLADIREDPDRLRDPASVDETFEPTDGAAHVGPATDGGERVASETVDDADDDDATTQTVAGDDAEAIAGDGAESLAGDEELAGADGEPTEADGEPTEADGEPTEADDPWAAERFLDDIEGSAYGTDPEMLREGLETVVERDEVWVSPGMPFIVPMFVGLVVAVTYGDVLFAILSALGFA